MSAVQIFQFMIVNFLQMYPNYSAPLIKSGLKTASQASPYLSLG